MGKTTIEPVTETIDLAQQQQQEMIKSAEKKINSQARYMKTKEMDAHSQQKRYQLCNVRDQISKKIMTIDDGNKLIFS